MRYDVMRILCFFDLPTETAAEKRAYRQFRKLSVYVRTCPNRQHAKKYYRILKQSAPKLGHIRLLMVTEKQFEEMALIIGVMSHQEEVIGVNKVVVI